MKQLMKRPHAAFTGRGCVPSDIPIEEDMYNVNSKWRQGIFLYNTFRYKIIWYIKIFLYMLTELGSLC